MKIMIAAGGTGGHIYPGIAIADTLVAHQSEAEIIFVGTHVGMEKDIIPKTGYPLELIRARGFERQVSFETLAAVKGIFDALWDAGRLLRREKPDLVIGTGGFTAAALLLVASRRRIPTLIHEQNAFPGQANRVLGKRVDRIALSFAEAAEYFPEGKTFLAGNPVDAAYRQLDRPTARAALKLNDEQRMVLVMGGSQGAGSINRAVVDYLTSIAGRHDRYVLQLTGRGQYETVVDNLAQAGITLAEGRSADGTADIRAYSDQVPELLAAADLVVCRAGAMSVAEIEAAGVPAIFVPFPQAAGDHQRFNAQVTVDAGSGVLLDESELTGESLTRSVESLLSDPARLARMGEAARSIAVYDAGERIYQEIVGLLNRD